MATAHAFVAGHRGDDEHLHKRQHSLNAVVGIEATAAAVLSLELLHDKREEVGEHLETVVEIVEP